MRVTCLFQTFIFHLTPCLCIHTYSFSNKMPFVCLSFSKPFGFVGSYFGSISFAPHLKMWSSCFRRNSLDIFLTLLMFHFEKNNKYKLWFLFLLWTLQYCTQMNFVERQKFTESTQFSVFFFDLKESTRTMYISQFEFSIFLMHYSLNRFKYCVPVACLSCFTFFFFIKFTIERACVRFCKLQHAIHQNVWSFVINSGERTNVLFLICILRISDWADTFASNTLTPKKKAKEKKKKIYTYIKCLFSSFNFLTHDICVLRLNRKKRNSLTATCELHRN